MDNFNAFASWVVFSIYIPFRVVRITTALHARSTHVTWPMGEVFSVDTGVRYETCCSLAEVLYYRRSDFQIQSQNV